MHSSFQNKKPNLGGVRLWAFNGTSLDVEVSTLELADLKEYSAVFFFKAQQRPHLTKPSLPLALPTLGGILSTT